VNKNEAIQKPQSNKGLLEAGSKATPGQKEGWFSMSEDKVSVDRKTLLTILVQVENALKEIQELKKEIKK
jgi:hypothetical protein